MLDLISEGLPISFIVSAIFAHAAYLIIRHMWLWFNRRRPMSGHLTDDQIRIICSENKGYFKSSSADLQNILIKECREWTDTLYDVQKNKQLNNKGSK